jgi:hypothetical protein
MKLISYDNQKLFSFERASPGVLWRCLSVLTAILFTVGMGQAKSASADMVDRVTFDFNKQEEQVVTFVRELYQDYIADLSSGSDTPVHIGIGISSDALLSTDSDGLRMNPWSFWILFDHPNACEDEGCKLVHLYRSFSSETDDGPAIWKEGMSTIGTGEAIRYIHFGSQDGPNGCIQRRTTTLYFYLNGVTETVPGRSCVEDQ